MRVVRLIGAVVAQGARGVVAEAVALAILLFVAALVAIAVSLVS